MCVSSDLAEFAGTVLYAGRCHHRVHGRIEVLGYQNRAVNLADGPNSMVLHVPASGVTRGNFLSAGRDGRVLTRMLEAVRPVAAAAGGAAAMDWTGGEVEVFEHDIYTVVLASDPTRIPRALEEVPPHKRPRLRPELFEFYADVFPGHTIVLCCFDNAELRQAKPLLLWYRPTDLDRLVLPALDSHTGDVPDLDAWVHPDHWLLFGTDEAGPDWGYPVDHGSTMRHELREFLPDRVVGAEFSYGRVPNGDFALSRDDLLRGDLSKVERVRPVSSPGPAS
ncbi:hypothetical protein [Saccharothrix syringae]|uniref:Uncharacterized protein n=1 Tax=Saccharothrix syringae TaxID=103733 RepID=A0A5Q0H1I9_SACSY|nr:hypothetical protein [Saccharothrix syringae]QFZ19552.1 hypothetical protein EKG83_20825 [Saccharothrix syringae]